MANNRSGNSARPEIHKTDTGCYLVCVSDGICTEFHDQWEAEEHIRNLEKAGLPTKRWTHHPSWWVHRLVDLSSSITAHVFLRESTRVKQGCINLRLWMKLQNHPKQDGRVIPVIRSILVFPVLHQRQQLMLCIGDEFTCPFLHPDHLVGWSEAGIGIGDAPENQTCNGCKHHGCPCRQCWAVAAALRERKSACHESKVSNSSVMAQVTIKDPLIFVTPDVVRMFMIQVNRRSI